CPLRKIRERAAAAGVVTVKAISSPLVVESSCKDPVDGPTGPECPFPTLPCQDPLKSLECCYSGTDYECHLDGQGNPVACPKDWSRCGLACTDDLSECEDPILDGHCQERDFGPNPQLCVYDCYDPTKQRCEDFKVCTIGVDCKEEEPCPPGQEHCGDEC